MVAHSLRGNIFLSLETGYSRALREAKFITHVTLVTLRHQLLNVVYSYNKGMSTPIR